jgi:hypothetical protein
MTKDRTELGRIAILGVERRRFPIGGGPTRRRAGIGAAISSALEDR